LQHTSVNNSSRLPGLLVFLVIVVVFASAFLLRIDFFRSSEVNHPFRSDALEYFSAAYNFKFHGVYSTALPKAAVSPAPDASRSPGYPLFLAALISTTDTPAGFERKVRFFQALIGSFSAVLVAWLVVQQLSLLYGLAAGIIVAIAPQLMVFESYMLTETLYTFELLVGVFAILWALKRQGGWAAILAGAWLGWISLTRPSAMLLPPFMVVGVCLLLWRSANPPSRKTAVFLLIGWLAVVSLFFVRNAVTLGNPFPESRRGWESIVQGSYPGLSYEGSGIYGYPYRLDPLYQRMADDKDFALQELKQRFLRHPARYLNWYLWGKIYESNKWSMKAEGAGDIYIYPFKTSAFEQQELFILLKLVSKYMHWPMMVLVVVAVGLWTYRLCTRQIDEAGFPLLSLLVLVVLYHLAQNVVFFPIARYTVPLRPEYVVLSLLAVDWITRWLQAKKEAG